MAVGRGRYARAVARDLDGVSVLWVDDHPASVAIPALVLRRSGATVTVVTTNDDAVAHVSREVVDVVISDIARDGGDEEGSDLGIRLAAAGVHVPLIHFVGVLEPDRPPPVGSVGVTNDADELLAMVRIAARRSV
jgi:CheY-like chemotaxis protein